MIDLQQYPVGIDYSRPMRWDQNDVFLWYSDYEELNAAFQPIELSKLAYVEPMDTDFFSQEDWVLAVRFEEQLLLALRFNALVQRWKEDTAHYSVVARRFQHESYKQILELGPDVVPFILEELRQNPDRWFSALAQLTGANPAEHAKTFYEAVDRWIAWGIQNDYLKDVAFKPSA